MKNNNILEYLGKKVLNGKLIEKEEAILLDQRIQSKDLVSFFEMSNRIRQEYFDHSIKFCAITNAKSGLCREDCSFCAQSLHHHAKINCYPFLEKEQILQRAAQAKKMMAHCFSLVTSGGKTESRKKIDRIVPVIKDIRKHFPSFFCAASLGIISYQNLLRLKEAGLQRYHHNLETSESFFPKVCTTHIYSQRIETIKATQKAGLQICSGGVFGIGETSLQRIELAFALRDLEVDCIPINFLHPIKGHSAKEKK